LGQDRKEIYKGKEIIYKSHTAEENVGEMHVKIDQKDLHVMQLEDGSYKTHFLPFQNYGSIEELSKDVIDKVPQFRKGLSK
jgi:hypothetical protein